MGIGGVVKPGFYRAIAARLPVSKPASGEDPEQKETQQDAAQPEKTKLPILHGEQPLEGAAPAAR